HPLDRRWMSGEFSERLSAGHVPQAHSSILAAGCQRSTVRAERHLPGLPLMAFKGVQCLSGSVPHATDSVVSRQGQVAAVPTVGQAADEGGAVEDHLSLQVV